MLARALDEAVSLRLLKGRNSLVGGATVARRIHPDNINIARLADAVARMAGFVVLALRH
jgi:hypothetical protein